MCPSGAVDKSRHLMLRVGRGGGGGGGGVDPRMFYRYCITQRYVVQEKNLNNLNNLILSYKLERGGHYLERERSRGRDIETERWAKGERWRKIERGREGDREEGEREIVKRETEKEGKRYVEWKGCIS